MLEFLKKIINFILEREREEFFTDRASTRNPSENSSDERHTLTPIPNRNIQHTEKVKNIYYKSFLDNISEGILVLTKTEIIYFNKSFIELVDYTKDEILSNPQEFLKNLFLNEKEEIFTKMKILLNSPVRDDARSFVIETTIKSKFGEFIPIRLKISSVQIESSYTIVLSMENLVELINYKDSLSKQKKRFELIFNNIPLSLSINDLSAIYSWMKEKNFKNSDELSEYILSADLAEISSVITNLLSIKGVNKTALKMTDASNVYDLAVKHIYKFFNTRDNIFFFLNNLLNNNHDFSIKAQIDGKAYIYSWIIPKMSKDYDECIKQTLVSSTELSDDINKRQIEIKFIKAYQELLQWQNDKNGKIIFCNNKFFEVFLRRCSFTYISDIELDSINFNDLIEATKKDEDSRHFIKRFQNKCNEVIWLDIWYYPIINSTKKESVKTKEIIGFVGLAIDISEMSEQIVNELRAFIYEGKLEKVSEGTYKVVNDIDYSTLFNSSPQSKGTEESLH